MTQCDKILRYLEDTGSITPLDALREFGCMRLGARIWDLRRRGHEITRTLESRPNRYGQTVRYARYTMTKE